MSSRRALTATAMRRRHKLWFLCAVAAAALLPATQPRAGVADGGASVAVGATAASFAVDHQGGAGYRIPLAAAPGPGRLQPSFALAYNSHTGNGPLGAGWTIEGLSAIHRCAAIAPLHGRRGRVNLDAGDRLCIDGRFLAPVDAAASPLQSRELRTRVESFTKVTARPAAAGGGFTAHTRDGNVVTYGDGANSRIEVGGGRTFSWLLSKITDRAGNELHVRYAEFGNERHVERIDYGVASMSFEYEPRADATTAYLAGTAFPLTQRLVRIAAHSGERRVREYRLAYESFSEVRPARLAAVTECAEDGACLRPTVFGWRPSPAFELLDWGVVAHPGDAAGEYRRYRPGDFNGDGLTDVYEIHAHGGDYDAIRINLGDGSFDSVPGPWTELRNAGDLANFHFADFNGDGLTDVYQFRYRDAYDRLYLTRLSQGSLSFDEVAGIDSGTAAAPAVAKGCVHRDCLRFGDFDGDGDTDVYRIRHNGAAALTDEVHLSRGDGTYELVAGLDGGADRDETRAAAQVGRLKTGDFNGDGVTDLYRVRDGADAAAAARDDIYLNMRPGEYRRIAGIPTNFNFRTMNHAQLLRVRFGDFNGDGLTDVHYAPPGGAPDQVHLSRGDGRYELIAAPSFPEASGDDGLRASLSRLRLADFNGDGKTDVYYMTGGSRPDDVYLAAAAGWSLREGVTIGLSRGYQEQLRRIGHVHLGDFNGDGAVDLYHLEDARTGAARIYAARGQINLIGSITDGLSHDLGAGINVAYALLTEASVHAPAAHTAPAAVRTPPAIRVVAAVEARAYTGAGAAETRRERHRYGGAVSDPSGFGFLGFAWREVHDVGRQLITRTLYSQAFPHFGAVLEQTTAPAEGPPLSVSRMEYATLELNDGRTVFPYLRRTQSRRYELGGAFVSATTTSFSGYDEYGNVGTVETLSEDDHRDFSRVAHYEYLNDRERWLLGLRVRVRTLDRGLPADVARTAEFEYDPGTGFLLAETTAPGNPLAVTRRYEYDAFGNRVAEHAAPASPARAVVVRREYDDTGRFAVRVVNPEGHAAAHAYDERFGRAVLSVDANGLATRREYDGWGRLVGERRADGTHTTITRTYDLPEEAPPGGVYAVLEETAGRPLKRTLYDALGRVVGVRTVGFDGRVLLEEREYDRYGRATRISLPHHGGERADWVERRYDRLDRLLEESSPLIDGAVTVRRFDYRGLAAEHTDELGRVKVITRDALGRVVGVAEPMGSEMSFAYDPAGRMVKATDAHGNETVMEYDVFGNRVRIVHPGGRSQSFAYDAFGRVVRTVDAAGAERRMAYDRLGRLTERGGPEGTARWSYDASEHGVGKLSQEFYGGHARGFRYDRAGRLAAIEDHRGYVTAMTYAGGRLREIRYPRGFVVERRYNEHGYLSAVRSPVFETGDFSTAPALAEMRSEDLYRGKAEEYASRASFYRRWAARLDTADGAALAHRLNHVAAELERAAARLDERAPDAPAAAYCEHAVFAKLTRAAGLLGDAGEAGVQLRLRPSGGTPVKRRMYARLALSARLLDEAQACLSVTPPAGARPAARDEHVYYWRALAQDTVGRVVSERTGDGWLTARRYHTGNGYLQRISSSAGAGRKLRHLVYDYDEADNLMVRSDRVQQVSEHFGYDDLDRVTAAVVLGESDHDDYNKISFYRYDALGNLAFSSAAGAYVYTADAPHAAAWIGDDAYAYDAAGNVVGAPGFTGGWFSFGKPEFLETADGNRVEFAYDANGNRVSKRAASGDVVHYHGKLYERTFTAAGAVEHRYYIYAGDRLVAVRYDKEDGPRVGRRLRYLHHDALGSVDTLSDDAGEVVARLSYTPFGERRASDWRGPGSPRLPALVNRGFTGHEHLDEVGLIHMNGRIYDPRVGRFLSPDPYVPSPLSAQSYNRYSYALNNPMRFTDPSGFFLKRVFKGIRRVVRKAVRFVRSNARVITAVAVGYYAGVWASNAVVKSAAAKLAGPSGGVLSGAHLKAYHAAVVRGAVVGGAVSGGVSSALVGGDARAVLANAVGGGVLGKVGVAAGGQWGARRVLSSAVVNGATAAAAGGSFRNAALSSLQWGGLRYAAAAMRRAMVAQSLLNPDNASGLSKGFFGDNFKLGGGRYNVNGGGPSPLGGHQGGPGELFGAPYAPDSLWDRVVEAYAGPHDYLNSFYWYDAGGNIKSHLGSFQRHVGEVLNGVNVFVATPFAAAALTPDYAHAL